MFDLIVLADIGQTIKEYISKNLIPSWVSFVVARYFLRQNSF